MALPKKVTPPPKVTPKPNIGDASLYVNLNPTPVANTLTSKVTGPPTAALSNTNTQGALASARGAGASYDYVSSMNPNDQLTEWGKIYNSTSDANVKKFAHTQANGVRNSMGLREGVDYNPTNGAAISKMSNTTGKANNGVAAAGAVQGPPVTASGQLFDPKKFEGWTPQQIMDYMTSNSATFGQSTPEEKARKAAENKYLGGLAGGTYDSKYGWSFKGDPTDYFDIEAETDRIRKLADAETDPAKKAFYLEQIKRLERQESKQFDGMDPNEIDASINAYLAENVSPLEQQIAQNTTAMNFEVGQNDATFNDSMRALNEEETLDRNDAVNLQNRRGGFYSGGLDYQNAMISRTYGGERGKLARDRDARNAEIRSRYGASTTALTQQITAMRANAPNVLKDRISKAAAEKAEANRKYAETYGYDPETGQMTVEGQKAQADIKHTETLDAIAKNKDAREDLKARMDAAEKVGVINDPTLAKILGVPVGTPTLAAKKLIEDVKYKTGMLGVAKQNANTSASRAATSAANTATDNARADSAASRKELMDIWKATGKAPAGIPGVKPGTPWNGSSSGGSSSKTKTYTEKDVNDMAIQNSGGVRAWGELSAEAKSKARAEARKILGITPEKKKEPAKPAVTDGEMNDFLKKKK